MLELTNGQGFSFNYIAKWSRDIVEGLVELQKNKVAHFDIKPENLLIKDIDVIIGDFGSA